MDFFGVGPLEILLVVLLALVLFGPKDIASNARSAGRFLNQLYKSEGCKTMTRLNHFWQSSNHLAIASWNNSSRCGVI
jgi:hypothetical protein